MSVSVSSSESGGVPVSSLGVPVSASGEEPVQAQARSRQRERGCRDIGDSSSGSSCDSGVHHQAEGASCSVEGIAVHCTD